MIAAPDLLGTIVAATRRIVEVREASQPARALAAEQTRTPRGVAFAEALRGDGETSAPRIIAECKRRSPSRGILRANYVPAQHEHLKQVRAAVDVPLLRKDFIVTEYQLIEAAVLGADAVLLIVGALEQRQLKALLAAAGDLSLAALVEVHDLDELRRAIDAGAAIIGVNSRNLRTLSVDPAVLDHVATELPAGVTAVAESGIRTADDIARLNRVGYHAFLVGERLIAQPDPGAALRELQC
jgi:indole-3-glycerol phosphate synthase